jgi:outer membrane protein assembly factor BamA
MTMLALALTMLLVPMQEPTDELTRSEELQLAREEKANHLEEPKRSFLEKGLHEFKERRIMERFQGGFHGFHPLIGGLKTGSGFSFGTSYDITDRLKASAQVSTKAYQKYEVVYATPRFLSDRLFAEIRTTYRSHPDESFYGLGNDTREETHTHYGLKDKSVGGKVGVRLQKNVKAGIHAGWVDTTVDRGKRISRTPSVAEVFDVKSLPAFDSQVAYLRGGAFFDVDTRDEPGNPRDGGHYTAKWTSLRDQSAGLYNFAQYDIEVQHYIPFFNQRRVIALRAKTTLTRTDDDQTIPFYMLPALGGSEDLRGFADFRFRDRNMVVVNAEYRWEAFSALDVAIFADAGQVAAKAGDFRIRDMNTAAGFGFRFNTAKKVFYRVDVGFSREGVMVYMKFGNVF